MARIRSIHPALFTDEAFVCLSMAARVLFIGIWTEADDHGVFEWKPVALKMRIFPADNVDISGLLEELIDGKFVCSYPHEGRQYGAVRNFCKFQHPKKPAYRFFIPDEFLPWVGSSAQKGEPEDDEVASVPKKGEIPLQMERREEEERGGGGGRAPEAIDDLSTLAIELADEVSLILGIGTGPDTPYGWCGAAMWFQAGLTSGWNPEVVRIAARKIASGKRDGPPSTFRYLEKPITREHELAMTAPSAVQRIRETSNVRPRGARAAAQELAEQLREQEQVPQRPFALLRTIESG